MRRKLCVLLLALSFVPFAAGAQETRGNINGTVQDKDGVIPGAVVRITNTDTNQTVQRVTDAKGYFEVLLLISGTYAARVEVPGYKTLEQTGIVLAVGQTLSLPMKLEVGAVSEEVRVTAQAPLLDTSTVAAGQNFDRRLVESLPTFSNMPIMLARYTPGVTPAEVDVQNVFQGYMEGTTNMAGGQVGTGSGFDSRNTGNNYTIDGAQNNGFGRRIASSPNSDQIEEVRIETSNFDASQGHGTGVNVSMSTRGGTSTTRGSFLYTHWNNKLNSPNLSQKVAFKLDPRQEDAFRQGREHIGSFTLGGPLSIPKISDGKKTFYFVNYSQSSDSAPGRLAGTSTVPANEAELNGDFSDLLLLPSGAGANTPAGHHQYQIYDPLSVHADPNRPGGVLRDPFPGNIIPKDRFMNPDGSYKNPAFALYRGLVPAPNQNFITPNQEPNSNFYRAAEPDQPHNVQGSFRVDHTRSQDSRFFVRLNGNKFEESSLSDWSYAAPDPSLRGLHDVSRNRFSWSGTGTWTRVLASKTVIDTQVSANRAHQRDTRKNLTDYVPTQLGLPSYLDDYCKARFECLIPQQTISGYQGMGGTVDGGIWVTTYQAQSNLTSTRASHTIRGGVDVQLAQRTTRDGAGNMGTFSYNNSYTRAADTTSIYPSGNLGLSLAAFMMGLPSSVSISDNQGFDVRNNYFGTYVQDSWRVRRSLTINLGLRFEWENGIKESQNRAMLWFDPTAENSITAAAKAAYAAKPDASLPVSEFNPVGGSVYEGAPGYSNRTWEPEALFMPRLAIAYKLGEKTVLKSGYGVYYDTINARDWTPNQDGYSVTTTNNLSTDFGQTFLLGDPVNGVLPLADPFPIRDNGTRYEIAPGNALGLDNVLGRGFNAENPNRVHSRVQRWRFGLQRELNSRTAVEIAYTGSYADRQGISIRQDYLPEEFWTGGNVRNTSMDSFLQQNIPNPFYIGTSAAPSPFYAAILDADPLLAQRLQGSTTFTSSTIQRQRLLRPFPEMNNLAYRDQPLGIIKAHSLELTLTRRYANGLSGSASFTANRVTENRTVEEYDRAPTLWQTNSNGRPWRFTSLVLYELPFGADKPWLRDGALGAIAGGWQVSATYEYQPGQLLNWNNNLFFNGDLGAIKKDKPEIALQPDGTFDPTKTWFNIDSGFVRATADQPGQFQTRAFPFKIDGLRGFDLSYLNMNIARQFNLGARRSFKLSVSIENLLNRQHYGDPSTNPTSTNFGQVRSVTNDVMRFITFDAQFRF
jgi:hypothetical protein